MNHVAHTYNSQPVIIACAGDDKFSLPMAVMLYSVMVNSRGSNVKVYILNAGISAKNQNKISEIISPLGGKLHWIEPNHQKLLDLPVTYALPLATWYRLLIPEVIPPEISKVIYLDCDLLVETDITRILNFNFKDYYLLAATDRKIKISKSALAKSENFKDIGDQPYFNAGFMVMNLDIIRQEKVMDNAISFARENPDLISTADQDALNAVSIGKWCNLDPCYNLFVKNAKDGSPFIYKPKCILHFIGNGKPWMYDRTQNGKSNDIEFAYKRYYEYLRRSGWFSGLEWFCFKCKYYYYRHGGIRLRKIAYFIKELIKITARKMIPIKR